MSSLERVVVTPGPHIKSPDGTRQIMADVIIALIPALVIAVTNFGFRALTLTITCVLSALVFETLYNKITKNQKNTIVDLTAVITGILVAYNMPVAAPLWLGVIGSFFAIVVVKMIFGGLGHNFMNPALGGRVFMFSSWGALMAVWAMPGTKLPLFANAVDVVTTATPLASLKKGILPDASLLDMFLGQIGGSLGEISAMALLVGLAYLLIRKVITPIIPVSFIATVFLIAFLFPKGNDPLTFGLAHILSGGVMLGAIFMATDYSTSPVTENGQFIFGIGCGLITMFIRYFGSYPEGVSFAILIMNALVFLIDKYTFPRRFGVVKKIKIKQTKGEAFNEKG